MLQIKLSYLLTICYHRTHDGMELLPLCWISNASNMQTIQIRQQETIFPTGVVVGWHNCFTYQ